MAIFKKKNRDLSEKRLHTASKGGKSLGTGREEKDGYLAHNGRGEVHIYRL